MGIHSPIPYEEPGILGLSCVGFCRSMGLRLRTRSGGGLLLSARKNARLWGVEALREDAPTQAYTPGPVTSGFSP